MAVVLPFLERGTRDQKTSHTGLGLGTLLYKNDNVLSYHLKLTEDK